jgi:putative endonuclease
MANHNKIGIEGEDAARIFLQKQGYRILLQNWHFGHYELDIIAEKEGELVIVEVKTRSSHEFERPEDAVGKAKIRRIVAAADEYMQQNGILYPARFDIMSIFKSHDGYLIEHIVDAFYPPIDNF